MYLQILVCASGCFAIQQLSYVVNLWCDVTAAFLSWKDKDKLFYTGMTALLAVAMIYHSVYNTLVQSEHRLVGFLLPVITFIPVLVLLNKTESKEKNGKKSTNFYNCMI